MPALDVLKASWIFATFVLVFLWVPARLFSGRSQTSTLTRIAGNWTRMVLCVTAAVVLLAALRILTAITVILLLAIALAAAWLRKHAWQFRGLMISVQTSTLRLLRRAEGWSFGMYLLPRMKHTGDFIRLPGAVHPRHWLAALEKRKVITACLIVVVTTSTGLLFQHALRELRFDQVEQYGTLLRARELVLNLRAWGRPVVFPAVAAATSLVSATLTLQVIRFLYPLFGLLLVLAAGLTIRACTRSSLAGIVAMYCLGAAAFPPTHDVVPVATTTMQKLGALFDYTPAVTRPSPESLAGLVVLLLGFAFLAEWHREGRWDSLIDLLCCAVLVGVISQYLLIVLVLVGAVTLVIGPTLGLVVFALASYGMAAYATLSGNAMLPNDVYTILPLAAAVGMGCLVMLVRGVLGFFLENKAEAAVLAGFVALCVFWLRPHNSVPQFLEYEVAARKTQDIKNDFPPQRWLVVAPVEQLSGTFGFGGFEDLASFVEKYHGQVSNSDFEFPDAPDDIFIFVEKTPFQMFAREPAFVSFAVLSDSTYRNYRSPAGRASLETAALQFCEDYRRSHSDATVYFEDEKLRIYRVHGKPGRDASKEKGIAR